MLGTRFASRNLDFHGRVLPELNNMHVMKFISAAHSNSNNGACEKGQ